MEMCRVATKNTDDHRGLHVFFTSVVDTKATAKTLAAGELRVQFRPSCRWFSSIFVQCGMESCEIICGASI